MKIYGFYHNTKLINNCKVIIPQVIIGLMFMEVTFTFTNEAIKLLAPYIDIKGMYQSTNAGIVDKNTVIHLFNAVQQKMMAI